MDEQRSEDELAGRTDGQGRRRPGCLAYVAAFLLGLLAIPAAIVLIALASWFFG